MRSRGLGPLILLAVILMLPPSSTVGRADNGTPGGGPPRADAVLVDGPVVAFGGDVNLGRWQNSITARAGPAHALAGVPELMAADLAVVNLESVIATAGATADKGDPPPFYFRGRPEMLAVLAEAGIDVVGTANNHSGDFGPEALLEQAGLLDGMKLGHAGSGPNRDVACAPVVRHAAEFVVAVFSVDATMPSFAATVDAPGTCYLPWDDADGWRSFFAPRIAAARRTADIVLVAVHCGGDFEPEPRAREVEVGHALIEAGADAVLGSSAHVLNGVEVYQGRPIIHDAGNLLWPMRQTDSRAAVFSLVVERGGVREVRITPIEVEAGSTRAVGGDSAASTLATLRERSAPFGTAIVVEGDRAVITLPPLPERAPPTEAAPPDPPLGPAPAPATTPPFQCVAAAVPEEAQIEPRTIGPLTLVGVSFSPASLNERTTLWLETYWTTTEPVATDLVIAAEGSPRRRNARPWEGDHEPCDWAWPTSRWTPGTIYHDRYGLRPPRLPITGVLDVSVGLRDGDTAIGAALVVARIPVVVEGDG